jgi:hypothetical protein
MSQYSQLLEIVTASLKTTVCLAFVAVLYGNAAPYRPTYHQDKNLNLRPNLPICCMLDPSYILNLTNIYLQVKYFLYKSTLPSCTQDRNRIISEYKTQQNSQLSYNNNNNNNNNYNNNLQLEPIKYSICF